MYEQYFGFNETPFSLTPNTNFFFAYPDHQEALNVLQVALRMGEGFIKVIGEVGTGKTLLCRQLLNLLDGQFVTAYLPNPFMAPAGLRHAFAEELGIEFARNIGQHRVMRLIYDRLIELRTEGKRVVLILDEAQSMPCESLEALRLMTNLETEKSKLMQVVLFAQPELDQQLAQRQIRQLRQRITYSYQINPMNQHGVRGYLQHRLQMAGYSKSQLFRPRAVRKLYRASRGVPRLVNILAHKAMLAAYGEGAHRIERRHINRAIKDTQDAIRSTGKAWRWGLVTYVGFYVSTAVGAGAYVLLGGAI